MQWLQMEHTATRAVPSATTLENASIPFSCASIAAIADVGSVSQISSFQQLMASSAATYNENRYLASREYNESGRTKLDCTLEDFAPRFST